VYALPTGVLALFWHWEEDARAQTPSRSPQAHEATPRAHRDHRGRLRLLQAATAPTEPTPTMIFPWCLSR